MSSIGIVAYTAEEAGDFVEVKRSYAGNTDVIKTDNWDKLVDFLTEDKGLAIHIVWSLYHFSNCIFSLLPLSKQKELENKPRVLVGDTKIFNVDKILGLTVTKKLPVGNFYSKAENNFYAISHWLPAETPMPTTVTDIEQLGNDIVIGLNKLDIYPDKLTSPIGVFNDQLNPEELPTIYNFDENHLIVMNWADQMARYEWRKIYKRGKLAEVYHYDLTSAYPYFIMNLPDTRQVKIEHSNNWQSCDWGIVRGTLETTEKVLPVDKNAKYFTTEEVLWTMKHLEGRFDFEDGWFMNFTSKEKPYYPIVNKLLEARNNEDVMASRLAKKIAQGLSGKLDQYNKDGGMGELYNPILASMVRSKCRLTVGDFIYSNGLLNDIIAVEVDGITTSKKINLPNTAKPGEWRIKK